VGLERGGERGVGEMGEIHRRLAPGAGQIRYRQTRASRLRSVKKEKKRKKKCGQKGHFAGVLGREPSKTPLQLKRHEAPLPIRKYPVKGKRSELGGEGKMKRGESWSKAAGNVRKKR